MNRPVALAMLILTGIIVSSSLYTLQSHPLADPEDIALNFIKGAPTFSFDGLPATLKVIDHAISKSLPEQHVITLSFVCLHGGYGDRTGKPITQALTPHTVIVTIIEGKVTSAVIDNKWDELNQKPIPQTQDIVVQIALDWLKNAPTFKFDGIPSSVKVVEVWQAQTFAYPSFWQVTIEFDSLHAGYGDRAGQILAQVITHHSIRVHVTEGVVTLAIMDEKWDELKQSLLPSTHMKEEAEQIALRWLYDCPTFRFDGIKDSVKVLKIETLRMPNTWEVYFNFVSAYPGYGNRTGNVMYGPSQKHTIRILVQEGTVTRAIIDDIWDEMKQTKLNQDSLVTSSETARDYVIRFLIKTYNLGYEIPQTWSIEDLTPPNTLGVSVHRYISGPWTVLIKYPVVLKPTYSISISYGGSSPFTWEGTLSSNGEITKGNTSL